MIRHFPRILAGLAVAAVTTAPASALTWQELPFAGVSATSPIDLSNYEAVAFNSMITDNAVPANLFVAVQLSTGASGTAEGRVIIYKPSGLTYTTQVVNLSDGSIAAPGPITKLVVAGDGKVYGLQNWGRIKQHSSSGLISRVIRINLDGTVDKIFEMNQTTQPGERLGGITVGGDGFVYFTNNGTSNAGKNNFFYRYNFSAVTMVLSGNNGFSQTHRLFDLEYVGRDGSLDYFGCIAMDSGSNFHSLDTLMPSDKDPLNPGNQDRSVNSYSSTGGNGYIGWSTISAYDPIHKKLWVGGRGNSLIQQGWKFPSAPSYTAGDIVDIAGDPGNHGIRAVKLATAASVNWRRQLGDTAAPKPTPNTADATLVARFSVDAVSTTYASYIMRVAGRGAAVGADQSAACGLGIRQVSGAPHLMLINIGDPNGLPAIPTTNIADLGAISVGTGTFYEVGMYARAISNTSSQLRVWLNGTEVSGSPFNLTTGQITQPGEVVYGTSCRTNPTGTEPSDTVGTCTITFDYVGFDPGLLLPDVSQHKYLPSQFRIGALGPTSNQGSPTGTHGILAAYLDGDTLPELWVSGNMMVRWNGDPTNGSSSLFTGPYSDNQPGIGNPSNIPGSPNPFPPNNVPVPVVQIFQTNANDVLSDGNEVSNGGTNITNGGRYWVSAMAINPCDGAAWYSLAGEQNTLNNDDQSYVWGHYRAGGGQPYMPEGQVIIVGADATSPGASDNGPQAIHNSQIVALHFDRLSGRTVFAVAADKATGTYRVYKAFNTAVCCNEPASDVEPGVIGSGGPFGDGDVDINDFGVFQKCYKRAITSADLAADPSLKACSCLDYNHNGQPDDLDFEKFKNCAELQPVIGPFGGTRSRDGVAATPGCDQ